MVAYWPNSKFFLCGNNNACWCFYILNDFIKFRVNYFLIMKISC